MAAQSLVIVSTSSPTAVAGTVGAGGPYHGYIRVRLKSVSGTHYLGDSGVTTAGYPLTTADAAVQETLAVGESLWTCSTAAASLAVLRMNETT